MFTHLSHINALRRRQRGMSTLDMLIWVGLAIIVLIIIVTTALYVRNYMRVMRDVTNINLLHAEVVSLYSNSGNFATLTQTTLVNARKVPDNMLVGTNLQNSFGGVVTIAPAQRNSANDAFSITWPNIPQSACTDIITKAHPNYYRVTNEGINVKNLATSLQIDPNAIATSCNNDSNTIVFFAQK